MSTASDLLANISRHPERLSGREAVVKHVTWFLAAVEWMPSPTRQPPSPK
jgi:hypothetical protein